MTSLRSLRAEARTSIREEDLKEREASATESLKEGEKWVRWEDSSGLRTTVENLNLIPRAMSRQ